MTRFALKWRSKYLQSSSDRHWPSLQLRNIQSDVPRDPRRPGNHTQSGESPLDNTGTTIVVSYTFKTYN